MRDFELIRKLQIEFEQRDAKAETVIAPQGYSNEEIRYNIELLIGAGFVSVEDRGGGGANIPKQLTWTGHEFLDTMKADGQWEKVKTFINEKSISLTFDSIKVAAATLVKSALT